jgi:hypothetical protein
MLDARPDPNCCAIACTEFTMIDLKLKAMQKAMPCDAGNWEETDHKALRLTSAILS